MTVEPEEPNDPTPMESDDEDDDYVPEASSSSDENHDVPLDSDVGPTLSLAQRNAVDDAFRELFGRDHGQPDDDPPRKGPRTLRKRTRILSSIFGERSALRLLARSKFVAASGAPKPSSGGMARLDTRVVRETTRFAGRDIVVERVVTAVVLKGEDRAEGGGDGGTRRGAARDAPSGRAKGLDGLLSEMARPDKMSAVSKTSADWDLFKHKNAGNLKDELERKAMGNEAFLVKKEFLNRVDHRRFELERAQRDRERAARGKK